jgi:hypothetical protein
MQSYAPMPKASLESFHGACAYVPVVLPVMWWRGWGWCAGHLGSQWHLLGCAKQCQRHPPSARTKGARPPPPPPPLTSIPFRVPTEFFNGLVGEYGAIPLIVNLIGKFHEDRLMMLIVVELLTLLAENGNLHHFFGPKGEGGATSFAPRPCVLFLKACVPYCELLPSCEGY